MRFPTQVTPPRALACALALAAVVAMPHFAVAQDGAVTDSAATPVPSVTAMGFGASARAVPQPVEVQHYRPHDARGINVFEPPKEEGVPYTGFKIEWGAAFTQQFQALHHTNTATPVLNAQLVNVNQLQEIGAGFNNAVANLYLDAQLVKGIRVEMTSYLSSRHHNETWVKDGYLLIDGSPWDNKTLDALMEVLTLRVGHFEINYGDMHFRRTDNGEAMFNPLVGNLIMDAFTTEIGAELYARKNGFIAMAGATGGEIRGQVTRPHDRAPSYLAKLGFDRRLSPDARVRLTGSLYTTAKSVNNTLYSGSRAGSRYYWVLENTLASESANPWSGDLQPGQRSKVTAWVVNPFVQFHGLELFGNVEQSNGRAANETADRKWNQYAGEGVYRLCANQFYLAARYNVVKGRPAGATTDATIDRIQAGGGWFLTPNIEMKTEYVRQTFKDFAPADIRNGGRFEGMMVEGVVTF